MKNNKFAALHADMAPTVKDLRCERMGEIAKSFVVSHCRLVTIKKNVTSLMSTHEAAIVPRGIHEAQVRFSFSFER